jgi:hypothetical protein
MDKYIHRENLNLLRRRLSETHDDGTHKVLLKLLAEEEAKEAVLPKDRGAALIVGRRNDCSG